MKINETAQYMGITQKALAEAIGTSAQGLGQYMTGRRGKLSEVVARLLQVSGLNREEIFFSNPFDHPDGENPNSPVYWLGLALEALHEATTRGLPQDQAAKIADQIHAAVTPFISD